MILHDFICFYFVFWKVGTGTTLNYFKIVQIHFKKRDRIQLRWREQPIGPGLPRQLPPLVKSGTTAPVFRGLAFSIQLGNDALIVPPASCGLYKMVWTVCVLQKGSHSVKIMERIFLGCWRLNSKILQNE